MSNRSRLFAENEQELRSAHRHVLFVLLHTLPMIFLSILMWIGAVLAYRYIPWAPGFFALILLVGSLVPMSVAIFRLLWWRSEEYIVTNYRIIQVEGILSKRSLDSSLGRINDVEMKQSMFGRMFDYGDINILTGSSQAVNDLLGINQPFEFKRALQDAKNEFEGLRTPAPVAPDYGRQVENYAAVNQNHTPAPAPIDNSGHMEDTARIDGTAKILAALTELRNSGVMTEDEYQEKLRKVLNN